MADKTIPQLDSKTTIINSDLIPVDDGTQTYKMTFQNFLKAITGVVSISLNSGGDGIVVTLRDGSSTTIITHDGTKQALLEWDNVPTENSQKSVKSGGIYSAISGVADLVSAEASTARGNEEALANRINLLLGDFATYEANDTASQPYAENDLVVLSNGVFYKVTQGIATNAPIVPGTNVSPTTVEEVFHRIKPVTEGGTGAATASDARLNLGLGGAAVKNVAAAVEEDDNKLPTGGAVYTAVKAVKDALDNLGLYIDQTGYLCQRIAE